MELFIGLVGLVGALLLLIATAIIIIMLREQGKELDALASQKADNKEAFRQIVKKELKPLAEELNDLLLMVDALTEGTIALAGGTIALLEQVEDALDEECKGEKDKTM